MREWHHNAQTNAHLRSQDLHLLTSFGSIAAGAGRTAAGAGGAFVFIVSNSGVCVSNITVAV